VINLQFNDFSEIPAVISSTNFTQISIEMRSSAKRSRDAAIERWRQLLHKARVCQHCPDCATCFEENAGFDSSSPSVEATMLPVTSISLRASSSSASPSQSSLSKLLVACDVFEKKDVYGFPVVVMDEQCLSHLSSHSPNATRGNQLRWFKEECQRLRSQQTFSVLEVQLPEDADANWKVSRMSILPLVFLMLFLFCFLLLRLDFVGYLELSTYDE
jgi:hypothetical protein